MLCTECRELSVVSEETLNVVLAQLLLRRGLRSLGEARIHGLGIRKPDVFMVVNGVKVILEGKYRQVGVKELLEGKCRERIDEGLCEICISVVYPRLWISSLYPNMNDVEKSLLGAKVESNVVWIAPEGSRESGWMSVNIDELATLVRNSYTSVVSEDMLGKAVLSLSRALGFVAEKIVQIPRVEVIVSRVKDAMGLFEVGKSVEENG
jgi:hypothetical protein